MDLKSFLPAQNPGTEPPSQPQLIDQRLALLNLKSLFPEVEDTSEMCYKLGISDIAITLSTVYRKQCSMRALACAAVIGPICLTAIWDPDRFFSYKGRRFFYADG